MDDLQEFERYMGHLSEGVGYADRHAGLRGYCTGLMSPLSRKSVEPMAALVDPLRVRSRHQSLHHFEPVPGAWTPRSTRSVIHGRPVRSLATNREPAVGG